MEEDVLHHTLTANRVVIETVPELQSTEMIVEPHKGGTS